MFIIKNEIVHDELFRICKIYCELEVIKALCIHRKTAVLNGLCLGKLKALCFELFHELRKSYVVNKFRDDIGDYADRHIRILIKCPSQIF